MNDSLNPPVSSDFTLTLDEWRALNKRQGQFETDLATTNATLSAQGQILQEIRGDVRALAGRVNAPTPRSFWINVAMMVLGVGSFLGAVGFLAINPLKSEQQRAYEERREVNSRLIARGRELATLKESARWLEILALRSLDFEIEAQFIHGQREGLEDTVKAIDELGSRVDVQKQRFQLKEGEGGG